MKESSACDSRYDRVRNKRKTYAQSISALSSRPDGSHSSWRVHIGIPNPTHLIPREPLEAAKLEQICAAGCRYLYDGAYNLSSSFDDGKWKL